MKDLKHLIYFEDLLQEAQNELVAKAVKEGKIALGYNCYYIPEILMNLEGCFSTRLRAPPDYTASEDEFDLLFHTPARASHNLDGYGDILHDKSQLSLCARYLGARNRGRLQLSQRAVRSRELRRHGAYAGAFLPD